MGLMDRVKETAEKRGYLGVAITGSEKWNHPSEHNDWGKLEGVRADGTTDGTYDQEGHVWTDINMQVQLNLFKLKDLKVWLKDFADWISDVKGIWTDCVNIKRRWFNLNLFFGFVRDTIGTLGLTKTYWVSTVQSFDIAKSDLAGDKAHEILESSRPEMPDDWIRNLNNRDPKYDAWIHSLIDLEKKIYEELTYEQVLAHVESIATKFANGLYALKEDPSIVYVDLKVRPYDFKNGFSNREIVNILHYWSRKVLNVRVPVIELDENGQKSKMWREVKAAIVHADEEIRERKDEGKL